MAQPKIWLLYQASSTRDWLWLNYDNIGICPMCAGPIGNPAHQEDLGCENCGSTWRAQACWVTLLQSLGYSTGTDVSAIATDLSRKGLGISDDWRLARVISQKFDYTNTYLHRFPKLDLREIPAEARNFFEFVICSDVLEHIDPPLQSAFQGLLQLLQEGGFAVVSVPLCDDEEAHEFYPDLKTWNVKEGKVFWTDVHGEEHVDRNPEFHGGEGQVLAFRRYSVQTITNTLLNAGFRHVSTPPVLPAIAHKEVDRSQNCIFIAWK